MYWNDPTAGEGIKEAGLIKTRVVLKSKEVIKLLRKNGFNKNKSCIEIVNSDVSLLNLCV